MQLTRNRVSCRPGPFRMTRPIIYLLVLQHDTLAALRHSYEIIKDIVFRELISWESFDS